MKSLAAICVSLIFLSACTSHNLNERKAKTTLWQYITDQINLGVPATTVTIDHFTSPMVEGDKRTAQFECHAVSPTLAKTIVGHAEFQLAQDGKWYLTFVSDDATHQTRSCHVEVK
jgi:hypothetical protein